jgi:hypothetical protein
VGMRFGNSLLPWAEIAVRYGFLRACGIGKHAIRLARRNFRNAHTVRVSTGFSSSRTVNLCSQTTDAQQQPVSTCEPDLE